MWRCAVNWKLNRLTEYIAVLYDAPTWRTKALFLKVYRQKTHREGSLACSQRSCRWSKSSG